MCGRGIAAVLSFSSAMKWCALARLGPSDTSATSATQKRNGLRSRGGNLRLLPRRADRTGLDTQRLAPGVVGIEVADFTFGLS